jgi:acetyl-CoA C-acetyltransferase
VPAVSSIFSFFALAHPVSYRECAINMSGGLIAKGHPVGATGVAMLGSCFWQLKGKAPKEIQRKDPKVAATSNIGGALCASVCTVLRNPS